MTNETVGAAIEAAVKDITCADTFEISVRQLLTEYATQGKIYDYFMIKKGGQLMVSTKEHSNANFVQIPIEMPIVAA